MLRTLLAFLIGSYLFQESVPQKPFDEFILKFDLKFKTETPQPNTFEVSDNSGGLKTPRQNINLPYITLLLRPVKLSSEEVRIRVVRGGEQQVNRKIAVGEEVKIDVGYTEDVKEQMVPNTFTIYFLDKERKPVKRISILFDEEGYYYVNGEKRGKI